jgi:hypothetical protein
VFAGDTNLLYSDKNPKTLESIVNTELAKVYDWLQANKLTMNFNLILSCSILTKKP